MAKQSVWVLYVDKNKAMATFSSRGPTDASDFTGPKPDLVALGIEIVAPYRERLHLIRFANTRNTRHSAALPRAPRLYLESQPYTFLMAGRK